MENFDVNKVDVEKMSQTVNIPVGVIKSDLGLPLNHECIATDWEQARIIWSRAGKNSEKEISAKKRWDYLVQIMVNKATTFEEAVAALIAAPDINETRAAALKKMAELATTFKEAKETYSKSPAFSEASFLAIKKMAELATNWEEARAAYGNAETNSKTQTIAIKKMATFFLRK